MNTKIPEHILQKAENVVRVFLKGDDSMSGDMVQGGLVKSLIRFSVPLVLSGVLQQMYAWADAFVVGNLVGEGALAAIGATTAINNLFVMAITGVALGVSLLAARMYGQGAMGEMKKLLATFVLILGGGCVVVAGAGSLLVGRLLTLIHTPDDIVNQAQMYLQIVLLGLPFVAVYQVYAAVLRGMGESKAPLYAVLVAALINVGLDLILVGPGHMGVRGAAAATLAAQGMMAAFMWFYAARRRGLRLPAWREKGWIERELLKQGMYLGLPIAVQSSLSSLGSVALQNFMNGFGSATVAAITTAYRVDTVIMLPVTNLSAGISTAAAQNIGAGKPQRARRALLVGGAMMLAVTGMLGVLVAMVGGSLIAMFGVMEEATAIGRTFFRSISVFYPIYGLAMSLRGYLEGVGDVLFSSAAGLSALGLRIFLSYALAEGMGNRIIPYAEVASWGAMLLLFALRFVWRERKARMRQVENR